MFDWQIAQNAAASYMKMDGADGPSGGWVRADLVQSPGPIAYLVVEDLSGKLDEIEKAGGRVLVRSMPFAGGGEIGLFADPDGNVLGLWRRKPAGTATATPTPDPTPEEAPVSKESAKGTAKVASAPKAAAKPKKKK